MAPPPLALPHPPVLGIAQAGGEGPVNRARRKPGVEGPEGQDVVVQAGHGAVALVLGIEDEERSLP